MGMAKAPAVTAIDSETWKHISSNKWKEGGTYTGTYRSLNDIN